MPPRNTRNSKKAVDGAGDKYAGLADRLLADEHASTRSFLHCEVPGQTYKSYDELAKYLGLDTAKAVKEWFNSSQFKPMYNELCEKAILPRKEKDPHAGGPTLKQVQTAIDAGERGGRAKYTGYNIDQEGWAEIDFYAFALVRLTHINMKTRDGVFFGHQMTDMAAQQRIWHALRKARSVYNTLYTAHKAATALPSTPGSMPKFHTRTDSSSKRRKLNNLLKDSDIREPPPVMPQMPGAKSFESPPINFAMGDVDDPFVENRIQPPERGPRPPVNDAGGQNAGGQNAGVDSESESQDEEEPGLSDRERLERTTNIENPFDIRTQHGKYLTIHSVIQNFKDPLALRRMVNPPEVDAAKTAQELTDERSAWEQEVSKLAEQAKTAEIRPLTEAEKNQARVVDLFFSRKEYEPQDHAGACRRLRNMDPQRARWPEMPVTITLKSHQVTCVDRLVIIFTEGRYRGAIIGDATGLGKTYEMIAFTHMVVTNREEEVARYNEQLATYNQYREAAQELENLRIHSPGIPHIDVPPKPVPPPRAKPKLLIILPDLVPQWMQEILSFSNKLEPLVYYGDPRHQAITAFPKITGILTKDDKLFDGSEENANKFIVTSGRTFVQRHGLTAQKDWRRSTLNMSEAEADRLLYVLDPEWPGNLEGCFDIVEIDEAHLIKNVDTLLHLALTWLRADFYLMATAFITPNRISDFAGYASFIEPDGLELDKQALARLGCTPNTNFFELSDNHPAAKYRFSAEVINKWITGDAATQTAEGRNRGGLYLQKIYEKILIRRIYISRDPQFPERTIGSAMPNVHTRRIISNFTRSEFDIYVNESEEAYRKLVRPLPNGKIGWNRLWSRKLILLSTWLGWAYISKIVFHDSIAKWKALPNLLYYWLKIIREEKVKRKDNDIFDLPDKDDIAGLLQVLCVGAPDIRAFLLLVSELVILKKQKLFVVCSLPANQILLHAIFQALKIPCVCYTSELSASDRTAAVHRFTQDDSTMVFIGSYFIGSTGLNLQFRCHHIALFNTAQNSAAEGQAIGRLRRILQLFDVEVFHFYTQNSFSNRIVASTLAKAIPSSIADFSINLSLVDNRMEFAPSEAVIDGNNMDKWYLVDGIIMQGPHERIPEDIKPLEPIALIELLLNYSKGAKIGVDLVAEDEDEWEDEWLEDMLGADDDSSESE